jgi:hypothetical protein
VLCAALLIAELDALVMLLLVTVVGCRQACGAFSIRHCPAAAACLLADLTPNFPKFTFRCLLQFEIYFWEGENHVAICCTVVRE